MSRGTMGIGFGESSLMFLLCGKNGTGGGRHHEKGVSVAGDPHEIYKGTTSEKCVSVAQALNLQANLQTKKGVSVAQDLHELGKKLLDPWYAAWTRTGIGGRNILRTGP